MDNVDKLGRTALLFVSILLLCAKGISQKPLSHEEARALDHQNPVWESIRAHLPDRNTATAKEFEATADILRARRFLEDAIDYYGFALERGGEPLPLLNKLGVTQLELHNLNAARAYFQRAVKINKKAPEAWNNLGVIEYLGGHYDNAVNNYKRALKLDKTSATYHSNMGTAYFEKKDFGHARKEYDLALKLDPDLMQHHGTLGITSRMLSPEDHARFCFEMAHLYAQHGDEKTMFHYLTTASEAGFDIMSAMNSDAVFEKYRKDPRVLLIVKNSEEIRGKGIKIAEGSGPPPPIPPDKH